MGTLTLMGTTGLNLNEKNKTIGYSLEFTISDELSFLNGKKRPFFAYNDELEIKFKFFKRNRSNQLFLPVPVRDIEAGTIFKVTESDAAINSDYEDITSQMIFRNDVVNFKLDTNTENGVEHSVVIVTEGNLQSIMNDEVHI